MRRPQWLVLAAVGAVPASWYGIEQAMMQRNTFPPAADPHHNAHWLPMAVLAFMAVVGERRLVCGGWRLAAVVAGLDAIAVGMASRPQSRPPGRDAEQAAAATRIAPPSPRTGAAAHS